jgi:hypothetical protein
MTLLPFMTGSKFQLTGSRTSHPDACTVIETCPSVICTHKYPDVTPTVSEVWAKILCPNPTTTMCSLFHMGRANKYEEAWEELKRNKKVKEPSRDTSTYVSWPQCFSFAFWCSKCFYWVRELVKYHSCSDWSHFVGPGGKRLCVQLRLWGKFLGLKFFCNGNVADQCVDDSWKT